jgi:NADH-quinone oxidoreductase subunit F
VTRTLHLSRVLPEQPVVDLESYVSAGGGQGLDAARKLGPDATVEHVLAAGLRGRGGAGFPTGRKWEAVRAYEAAVERPTVVVNGAEGEPGSFKDRAILRTNPYAVLEGALIAAHAVDADRIIVALKRSFVPEVAAVRRVIADLESAGWSTGVELLVCEGPSEYLYGEETGLLEAIDGRGPFPRLQPPFRRGVEEVREADDGMPADVVMADSHGETIAPPTLVNNVETMANVPGILAHGPAWFRELGTDDSPGTIVCTITGATQRHGVGEFPMGTPLRDVIDDIGGGPEPGRHLVAAISGVANPIVTADQFDTGVSYEAMQAIGSGLGAAGFIVFDEATDMAAVAHGISRFLAVESCGQCTPCKLDGVALSQLLDRVRQSDATDEDLRDIDSRVRTVADSARCYLAQQHQLVLASLLATFGDDLRDHAHRAASEPLVIAPIIDIVDDRARLDHAHERKQPDWTYDATDSGKMPVDRIRGGAGYQETPLVPPISAPRAEPAGTTAPAPSRPSAPPPAHAVSPPHVHGIPVEDLDPNDPEARLYTSEPIETDEGTVVIQQQNVGRENEDGGGEWPDPHTPPTR